MSDFDDDLMEDDDEYDLVNIRTNIRTNIRNLCYKECRRLRC